VFVVVAGGVADDAEAHGLAARLLRELQAPPDGADPGKIRASVGISLTREQDPSAAAVLACAEAAIYAAKNRARRNARERDPGAPGPSREALVEAAFERSAREDFDVYYQPLADLRCGSVAAVEAVLRWEHAELGTIAPALFVPIAERRGQIVTLGRRVLEIACAQTVRWPPTREGRPMRTCVNVSDEQVADPAFADDVESALSRSGATGQQLALGMSERALASMSPRLGDALASAGVELTLRNVRPPLPSLMTTGIRPPVTLVKLHGSLLPSREHDQVPELLRSISELADRVGARGVAAGIETADQLAIAIAGDFALAQGNLFMRPQSGPAVEQLVRDERPFATLLAPRHSWLDLPAADGEPRVEIRPAAPG